MMQRNIGGLYFFRYNTSYAGKHNERNGIIEISLKKNYVNQILS